MKKILAICLTLSMLLGCLTIVSVAANDTVMINNCDVFDGGTNDYMAGEKATRMVDRANRTEGIGSWSALFKGDLTVGRLLFNTKVAPVDASAARYLCFDFYVDDASKINGIALEIEITSSGTCDIQEDNYTLISDFTNGWNAVIIPLEEFQSKGCDRAAVNFFRVFNQTQVIHAGEAGITCKLDNLRFTTALPSMKTVLVSNADSDVGFDGGSRDTANKAEGSASRKYVTAPGSYDQPGTGVMMRLTADPALDVTGTTAFEFDFYISDADVINGKQMCLELTSSGTCDYQENQIMWIPALKDGWNKVTIALKDFEAATGVDNAPMDVERFNFMRLFNAEGIVVPDAELVINIDNVYFSGYGTVALPDSVEKHMFRVFEASEEQYLLRTTAGNNGNQRFSDCDKETVYKFTVSNRWSATRVTFRAKVGAQLLLQVSQDNENWTDAYSYSLPFGNPANSGLEATEIIFDITALVDLKASPYIYIRIADSHPFYLSGDIDPTGAFGTEGAAHGWGGSIYKGVDSGLCVEYLPLTDEECDAFERAKDVRSMSLLPCSEPFGAFKLDKENKVAGASSLMMKIAGGQAPSTVFSTPVNGTGYDALEFELYVSDLALFDVKFGNTQLELTSYGVCDQEEIGWNLATIKECIVGEPVAGWNHVVLYFSDAVARGDNPFDITRINFFRFFMVSPEGGNCDMTVGIDNLRLTKAGTERDAKNAAENQAAADMVIQSIDKIGDVTLDSVGVIEMAENEFEALTSAQKELVSNYDVLTAARAKYDELKAADEEANKPEDEGTTEEGATDVETEAPVDDDTIDDGKTETPDDEKGGSAVIIIVIIAVAAVVVVILLAKKKK